MTDYIKEFRFFCQKVLPLVYDDSLSYYEVLCKAIKKINEIGNITNINSANLEDLDERYADLANKVEGLIEDLVDVIVPWDSSIAYHVFSIVEYQGTNYIAIQDVPIGVMITNTDYWTQANTVIEQLNAISLIVSELQKSKYCVTPEEYGALADGITDDTSAINSALNSGHIVYFSKNKTYAINGDDPIFVPSNTKILWEGVIKCTSDKLCSFEFYDRITETPLYTGVHDVYIYGDGTFDANGDNLPDSNATPFRIAHCKDIWIEGITIKNYSKYHAVEIGGSDNVTFKNVKFKGMFANGHTDGNYEAIQVEPVTETGNSGAIPYDRTMPKNINIIDCYFGPSDEGGEMYEAFGSHSGVNDATKETMYDGVKIEGCTFYHFSRKPTTSSTSVALEGAMRSVIGLDSNFKNVIIKNNIFDKSEDGLAIHVGQYSEDIIISDNLIKDMDGSAIAIALNVIKFSINDNVIKKYGLGNERNSVYNNAVGILLRSFTNGRVCNNYIVSESEYSTLGIHMPGTNVTANHEKFVANDNIIDVTNVSSSTWETTQSNFNRYNKDNGNIIYNDDTGIYTGTINFDKDIRAYKNILFTFKIEGAGYNSIILTHDQVIKERVFAIRDFNLANSGTGVAVDLYEMTLTISTDYKSIVVSANVKTNVSANAVTSSSFSSAEVDNKFIRIVTINGSTGYNALV